MEPDADAGRESGFRAWLATRSADAARAARAARETRRLEVLRALDPLPSDLRRSICESRSLWWEMHEPSVSENLDASAAVCREYGRMYERGVWWSPDGKLLAGGTMRDSICLWEVGSAVEGRASGPAKVLAGHGCSSCGRREEPRPEGCMCFIDPDGHGCVPLNATACPLAGHGDRVVACAFSPDSRRLCSISEDSTVRVWDVATMSEAVCLRGGHNIDSEEYFHMGCCFSADGRKVLSWADHLPDLYVHGHWHEDLVVVWDLDRPDQPPRRVSKASVGQSLVSPHNRGPGARPSWPDCPFCDVVPREADGGARLVALFWPRTVVTWDLSSGASAMWELGGANDVYSGPVAVSPDGSRIIVGRMLSDHDIGVSLELWDLDARQLLTTINQDGVHFIEDDEGAVAFCGAGDYIATAVVRSHLAVLEVWSAQDGSLVWWGRDGREKGGDPTDPDLDIGILPARGLCFSPDGRRLVGLGNFYHSWRARADYFGQLLL